MSVVESQIFLGLGSNLDNPKRQLERAIEALHSHPEISAVMSSSFYGSKPLGPQDQPDFVNAVLQVSTSLSPQALLKVTQNIEATLGRVKKRHWGERLIDVDILVYGSQVIDEDNLQIPHPQIPNRDFVLLPIQEISPNLSIPNLPNLEQMISALDETFVVALDAS